MITSQLNKSAVFCGFLAILAGCVLAGCSSDGRDGRPSGYLPKSTGPDVAPPPPATRTEIGQELKSAASQEFERALASNDGIIRAHAIEAVREAMGTGGRPQILRGLADSDPLVRFASAVAAGELRLEEARPLLLKMLNDASPSVQVGTIFALHRLGDVRYSAGLAEALASPAPQVRANAAFALGRLGEKSATKILRPALKDSSVMVRLQAAEALWRLGDEEGLTFLVAASVSRDPANQMIALLGLAGTGDRRVIEHIRGGLNSDYREVNLVAARALGMLGSDEAYVLATQSATSSEPRQRCLAALALGDIARSDARDVLAGLMRDADADVRLAAATAMLELR